MRSSTRRLFGLNVVAFVLVIGVCTAYLAIGVYQVRPGEKTTSVSLQLTDTNAVSTGTGVSVNGLRIGTVTSVTPNADGARVTLRYPRSQSIPRDSQVSIGQQSALGEPYVDFRPQSTAGPYLRSGDRIATESVQQSQSIPQIFSTIQGLTNVLSAGPMAGLLKTLSQALDGSGPAFDTLAGGSQAIAGLLNSRTAQLQAMFADTQRFTPQLGPVVDSLPALSSGLALLIGNLRGTSEALSSLVDDGLYEQLSQTIHPFLARPNPYLADILPNVLDAVGPLLPIATALNETLPQVDASRLLSQLLGVVGSDGAARLRLTIPPR